MRTRKPTPVGEMLKEEFLIPMGLTQRAFAEHLGCEVKTINRLVNNKTTITPFLAMKISSALGTTAEFWLHLQMANELWKLKNSKELSLPKRISA